jgi:hypothetical protein
MRLFEVLLFVPISKSIFSIISLFMLATDLSIMMRLNDAKSTRLYPLVEKLAMYAEELTMLSVTDNINSGLRVLSNMNERRNGMMII